MFVASFAWWGQQDFPSLETVLIDPRNLRLPIIELIKGPMLYPFTTELHILK